MSNLADQAQGLRHIVGRKRARVVAVFAAIPGPDVAGQIAAALHQHGQRVVLLTADDTRRPSNSRCHTFEDLARERTQIEIAAESAAHHISVIKNGDDIFDVQRLSPQAQSRLFDRLADAQQASDVVIIAAEGVLFDALMQVREVIVVVPASTDGILSAYRKLKELHKKRGSAGFQIYTLIEGAERTATEQMASNLHATVERFLSLSVRSLGAIDRHDKQAYRRAAERLLARSHTSIGAVALESCVAHLLHSEADSNVPDLALLIQ